MVHMEAFLVQTDTGDIPAEVKDVFWRRVARFKVFYWGWFAAWIPIGLGGIGLGSWLFGQPSAWALLGIMIPWFVVWIAVSQSLARDLVCPRCKTQVNGLRSLLWRSSCPSCGLPRQAIR
jgi:hypothetical protein